jgi:hypothetical protein
MSEPMAQPGAKRKKTSKLSSSRRTVMKLRTLVSVAASLLVLGGAVLVSQKVQAQDIDFGQISKFESLGTGTLHVGSPPKTIIDDDARHMVILTIYESDADTKVYWKPLDASDIRTTVMPGRGVETFKTAGLFKLEAVGDPHHRVKYGYVSLHLKSE